MQVSSSSKEGARALALGATRVVDQKRGVGAWRNAQRGDEDLELAAERLLIHSVSDSTALQSYLPAARRFVEWAMQKPRATPVQTWEEVDALLVEYQSMQC